MRSRKTVARLVAYSTATGDADKPEPAAEAKPEPAAEARPEPAAEARPEPRSEPKAEAKPEPAPAPAPAPKPAPVAADEPIGPIYEPLLKPKEIPVEDPEAAAPPPGVAPRGDSRSMRRAAAGGDEFILIYRFQTFVIQRAGVVGKRGRWKVVEYPTMGHASHAYAQECSRLTMQGFTDHRG